MARDLVNKKIICLNLLSGEMVHKIGQNITSYQSYVLTNLMYCGMVIWFLEQVALLHSIITDNLLIHKVQLEPLVN